MKDTPSPAKRLTLRLGDAWQPLGNDPQLLLLDTSDYTTISNSHFCDFSQLWVSVARDPKILRVSFWKKIHFRDAIFSKESH